MLAQLAVLAAEGTETINPVVPDDVGEIFWGAVSFFGLWILMRYVCLPPLLRIRAQREQQVQADREAAAAAETQAEQVRRDYDATIGEARAEAARVIDAARGEAEAARSTKVSAVEAEVADQKRSEMAELDTARANALGQLKGDVADLAVSAASKVVQSDLDPSTHRAAVDEYVNQAGGAS